MVALFVAHSVVIIDFIDVLYNGFDVCEIFSSAPLYEAGVAQLARASAFQADCREFESRLPLHGNFKWLFVLYIAE